MFRFVFRLILLLLVAAACAGTWLLVRSEDPLYQAQEWLYFQRIHRYDGVIEEVSKRRGLDPLLVRAVIWQESKFDARKAGKNGERGLMQVTEIAARDWAKAEGAEAAQETRGAAFRPESLYEPRVNIEVGTWYLQTALERWKGRDNPVPFALAEYNAGKSRVDRWIESSKMGERATGDDLRTNISFRSTRGYVEGIEERVAFYRKREKSR